LVEPAQHRPAIARRDVEPRLAGSALKPGQSGCESRHEGQSPPPPRSVLPAKAGTH
jgi:hypothetical protein